jgi:hypothetical protein
MLRNYFESEMMYIGWAFSIPSDEYEKGWRELTNDEKRTALRGLRQVVTQLRAKIGEAIKEFYKPQERPDGR